MKNAFDNQVFICSFKTGYLLCFFALMFCLSISLKAQNYADMVVSYSNDTLRGSVKMTVEDGSEILFKSDKKNDFLIYTPYDIQLIRLENRTLFKSKTLPTKDGEEAKKVFASYLVEGKISLYRIGKEFYVEKAEDGMILLENNEIFVSQNKYRKNNKHIGVLQYLMSDCSEMSSKLDNVDLKYEDMMKAVSRYNQCMDATANSVVHKNPNKVRTVFGLKAGLTWSDVAYLSEAHRYYNFNFDKRTGVSFGGFMNVVFNEKLALGVSLLFIKKGASFAQPTIYPWTEYVNFDLQYLQLPVDFIYTLPLKRKIKPFVSLGGVVGYALKNEGSTETFMVQPIEVATKEFGYRAGIGMDVGGKIRIGGIYEKTIANNLYALNEFANIVYKLSVEYVF
ncbi:MAG: porin family protein [Chitinophagales bacterium]